MLVFDQLRRDDRTLQVLSGVILLGMLVLLSGLWWVQIVSSKRHETNLKNQSFRSVRVPALRGHIYDRNGQVLAENRPRYDVNFYLEEILEYSQVMFTNSVLPQWKATNAPGARVRGKAYQALLLEARYRAVSNITYQVTAALNRPQVLETNRFFDHLAHFPYMPFPIVRNLSPTQVAIFSERFNAIRGLELEVQPIRIYPNTNTAAHLIGWVRREDQPEDDSEIAFKYYLPDYAGKNGMEGLFDEELRGRAGVKSLLVNNVGYRQREEVVSPTEAGDDLELTIDLTIQRAAEKALSEAQANVRGAAIVMDVRNGDVLAMASLPAYDPNLFLAPISNTEWARLSNPKYSYIYNRATFAAYVPGSIFKIITAIAILEAGVVDPKAKYMNASDPERPGKGAIWVGKRKIKDTAPAGEHDFERAFKLSSNSYFIHYGTNAGLRKIIEVGQRFHLGERTGAFPGHEARTQFPTSTQGYSLGNVANICIGQEITVTPMQMTCMTAAIANGGTLFQPRLVKKIGSTNMAEGVVTNRVNLHPAHLEVIQKAMLADVTSQEGTGKAAYIADFIAAGKTGTAEVMRNGKPDYDTWFASYAPYDNPRYAVVVMVESGGSGGGTCAPVARKIYEALKKREASSAPKATLAER